MSNNTDKDIKNRIYFPELDGLRFFAFLLVFVHHHLLFKKIPYFSFLHTNGWIGVDLFFVLSAFLFTKLLIAEFQQNSTINFKKFYVRRIFRIWPTYFLFIFFSIALYIFINGSIGNNIGVRIIGLFLFSDNIMTAFYGDYNSLPYLAHLWTITYEEQFYIFIPIIILLLIRSSFKKKVILLASVIILLNGIRFAFIANNVPHPAVWVLPITHFESIILGIVIGFGGFDFMSKIKPLLIGLFGVLFFIALYFLPNIDNISYWLFLSYAFVGISTSLVLFSVLNSNYLKSVFSIDLFVFLGKRSYGLYMYHLLGNGVSSYIIAKASILPANSFASFIYSLTFTIIVAIISYKFIETPFLRLKKKFEVITSRPI